jgi:hypothetical protein
VATDQLEQELKEQIARAQRALDDGRALIEHARMVLAERPAPEPETEDRTKRLAIA